jgi:hypothetical protein
MKNHNPEDSRNRRGFFGSIAALLAGAGVTRAASPDQRRSGDKASAAPSRKLGYRATAHIRTYYDKARF